MRKVVVLGSVALANAGRVSGEREPPSTAGPLAPPFVASGGTRTHTMTRLLPLTLKSLGVSTPSSVTIEYAPAESDQVHACSRRAAS
jgi:hypothetical protein